MVYTDNAGNVFLGDAIYSAGTGKLSGGIPRSSVSSEFLSLFTQSGFVVNGTNSVPSQETINNLLNFKLIFGFNGDIHAKRIVFDCVFTGGGVSTPQIALFNDTGSTILASSSSNLSGTNMWLTIGAGGVVSTTFSQAGYGVDPVSATLTPKYIGVSDGMSLALINYEYYGTNNNPNMVFWYAGRLADVNPNYGYYNTSVETDTILITNTGRTNSSTATATRTLSNMPLEIAHRIQGAAKKTLTTGDAQYPIVCSDGQTPTAQWATDMYVFDDNATLGYPAIGRVRNLLLAQGTYTLGKPVRIQGTAQPDNGFNAWLPVGTFAGKTVLMRCYSSVEL